MSPFFIWPYYSIQATMPHCLECLTIHRQIAIHPKSKPGVQCWNKLLKNKAKENTINLIAFFTVIFLIEFMIRRVIVKFTYTVAKFRCHPPNTSNRSYTFRPLESFPSIPEVFSNTIMEDTLIQLVSCINYNFVFKCL